MKFTVCNVGRVASRCTRREVDVRSFTFLLSFFIFRIISKKGSGKNHWRIVSSDSGSAGLYFGMIFPMRTAPCRQQHGHKGSEQSKSLYNIQRGKRGSHRDRGHLFNLFLRLLARGTVALGVLNLRQGMTAAKVIPEHTPPFAFKSLHL